MSESVKSQEEHVYADHSVISAEVGDTLPFGTTVYPLTIPLIDGRPAFGLVDDATEEVAGYVTVVREADEDETVRFKLTADGKHELLGYPLTPRADFGHSTAVREAPSFRELELVVDKKHGSEVRGVHPDGTIEIIEPSHSDPNETLSGNYYFYDPFKILLPLFRAQKEGAHVGLDGAQTILRPKPS